MKNKNKAPLTRGLSAKLTGGSGITLIALIITIIVMLILAVVSIKAASDSGLFGNAETAVNKTETEIARETAQDIVMRNYDAVNGIVTEDITTQLQTEIKGIKTVTGSITDGWTVEMKNGDKFTISKNGTVGAIIVATSNGGGSNPNIVKTQISIGDLVNYTPNSSSITIESGASGSGYSDEQILTTQQGMQWKVLDIDETTNQVTLVSATSTTATLYLSGANGWAHSVDILEDICKTCYSNSEIGATARSIDVEDINKISGITSSDFITLNNSRYGTTYTANNYGSSNTFPNFYLNGILTGIKGENDRAGTSTEYQDTSTDSNSDTVVTSTWYAYRPEDQQNYRGIDGLIIGDGIMCFWIASRFVEATPNEVNFRVGEIILGVMNWSNYGILFTSSGDTILKNNGIRPVVLLNSDTNFSYDRTNGWWNIN